MDDAPTLVPGDIVRLYLGDVVPADCKLIKGDYISIDQSTLTGESLPVSKESGEEAYAGSIVKQGEMTAVVTATAANTFFGRTATLVASAGSVSHFHRAVMGIGNLLIILALLLVVILAAARLFDLRGHYDRSDIDLAGIGGDLAILAGLKDPSILKNYQQKAYVPFDPVRKRTGATIKNSSGAVFRVTKGVRRFSPANCEREIRDSKHSRNCVGGQPARSGRHIEPSTRG